MASIRHRNYLSESLQDNVDQGCPEFYSPAKKIPNSLPYTLIIGYRVMLNVAAFIVPLSLPDFLDPVYYLLIYYTQYGRQGFFLSRRA
jgi:hypothetical protein